MVVPTGVSGRAELSISLVAEDGTVLADATSQLVVELPVQAAPKATEAKPPPRAKVPDLTPAAREAAEKFVTRGERELEQGQIAVARQFFLRAAQAGLARGALLLAATYDPRELARWRVQGVQPNLEEARKWYERARELGAPEAEERLARLGAG
jgi:TPR repeat protein